MTGNLIVLGDCMIVIIQQHIYSYLTIFLSDMEWMTLNLSSKGN